MQQGQNDPCPPAPRDPTGQITALQAGERVAIPVAEEIAHIDKTRVETGRVVVHIQPVERTEVIDLAIVDEHVEVERVVINRFIDAPLQVRQEGDVTIIPVMEEVLVVEKRLRLKEEVRLTKRRTTSKERQQVTLRTETAKIEQCQTKTNE